MANSVERYYVRKKRRKKRAKMVFFSLLFVLMLLTLAILSVTVFFNAEQIRVEGNSKYTIEELLETGGLKIGQNLFRLDKFEVIEKMETLPYVKEVTIKRKLPNTLTVKVVENEPVVWLPATGGVALLNEEYRVLELLSVALPEEPAEVPEEKPETTPEEKNEETTEALPEEAPEATTEETTEESVESTPEEEFPSQLEGIPQLKGVTATELTVGKTAVFGEEDYTGFLKRLYDGFFANPDLQWNEVNAVVFEARYDIYLEYRTLLTIDFGTLDQIDTKLQLAAHLINDNGSTQAAIVDVSDPKRVYFRPKK
ncbi:MAG: FtsQ-type POTRA domain-containing protein [Clostridia bacterium]|nr:FtsQ-type POTRA domain-containing protein [Clostridia bacterium]